MYIYISDGFKMITNLNILNLHNIRPPLWLNTDFESFLSIRYTVGVFYFIEVNYEL